MSGVRTLISIPIILLMIGARPEHASAQPVNDDCSAVVPVVIPTGTQYLFTGDNTGGTATGDAVPESAMDDGFARVWHAFVLPECADVMISHCGNAPVQTAVSSAISTGCPASDPLILATSQDATFCGDGNQVLFFDALPPGTYYLPIFSVFTPLGPYQVLVGASPCAGGPANDDCPGAYPLQVNAPQDCPGNATLGDNATATGSPGSPTCLGALPFQDVWYYFDPGPDTLLLLHAESITASEIGVELFPSCDSSSIHCAMDTVIHDTIAVTAFVEHRLRVFTQTDSGTPGTFGLCLSTLPPPIICEGGTISTSTADTVLSICKDGVADPILFTTTSASTEGYAYFLCTDQDTVLLALNGDSLDADTLPLGLYHVRGFSFNGTVNVPFSGIAVNDLSASGACVELSSGFVTLGVEICSDVPEGVTDPAFSLSPNPTHGELTITHPVSSTLFLEVLDGTGRVVLKTIAADGPRTSLSLGGDFPPGQYVLRCRSANALAHLRFIVL